MRPPKTPPIMEARALLWDEDPPPSTALAGTVEFGGEVTEEGNCVEPSVVAPGPDVIVAAAVLEGPVEVEFRDIVLSEAVGRGEDTLVVEIGAGLIGGIVPG